MALPGSPIEMGAGILEPRQFKVRPGYPNQNSESKAIPSLETGLPWISAGRWWRMPSLPDGSADAGLFQVEEKGDGEQQAAIGG